MPLPSSKEYLPHRRLVRVACYFVWVLFFCAIISYASTSLKLHHGYDGRDVGLATTSAGGLAKFNNNYPAIVTTLSTVPCDSECRRFQRLMAAWPRDKPKAALVYLVHRVQYLVPSIQSVSKFFCRQFDYPIVIFHEAGPFSSPGTRNQVLGAAAWNSSRVFFQQVEFKLPTFLTKPVLDKINCIGTIGYRHMCRF